MYLVPCFLFLVPILDLSGEPFGELGFGHAADAGVDDFAAFEDHQGRNAAYAVFGRGFGGFVDVDFHDLDLVFHFACDFFDDRHQHFAWTAPFCPEINENRAFVFDDDGLEIFIGDSLDRHGFFLSKRSYFKFLIL